MPNKQKILAGRQTVEAYREAHRLLHQKPYYRGVHDDHTPLLETMLAELSKQGFTSDKVEFRDRSAEILQVFFAASKLLKDGWN